MTRTKLSPYNVVASFGSMEDTRDAISRLGRAGVEADRVSLLGRQAEEAATAADTRLRDLGVTGDVARRAGAGAAAGAVAGGVIGLVAFSLPGVGPVIGAGIWSATGAGAAAGGAIGGFVAGVASIDLAEDWELTYQSVRDGRALVAVHAETMDEADRAKAALDKASPEDETLLFDAHGRSIKP